MSGILLIRLRDVCKKDRHGHVWRNQASGIQARAWDKIDPPQ
jgi:hypothetical protein